MSITEIASTGLLRILATAPSDTQSHETTDNAFRSVAFSTLGEAAGVVRSIRPDTPERAVRPPRRIAKPAKTSGDYRAAAKARHEHREPHTDADGESSSTFDSLI